MRWAQEHTVKRSAQMDRPAMMLSLLQWPCSVGNSVMTEEEQEREECGEDKARGLYKFPREQRNLLKGSYCRQHSIA